MRQIGLYIALVLFLSGCRIAKKLPEGRILYAGAKVEINNPNLSFTKKEMASLERQILERMAPQTHSMILGFPHRVWLHYVIGEPKKGKGIRSFLRDKLSQSPVFYKPSFTKLNVANLINVSENSGYFRTTATSEAVTKSFKTGITYHVDLAPRYSVNKIELDYQDLKVFKEDTVGLLEGSILKSGKPYSLDEIISERNRLASIFQDKGYFYMSGNQFLMEVDTNLNSQKLNIKIKLAPNTNYAITSKYYLRDVNVISTLKEEGEKMDTIKGSIENIERDGFTIAGSERMFKPKVFTESIIFRPGHLYSKSNQEASLNRLTNLKNFQYIRNKFELIHGSDSALLDVNYYLTPIKKKSIKGQLSGLTKSNGLYGSEATLSWQNRNLFHGAEMLKFELNGRYRFAVWSNRIR
jgi:hypothetical protein